MLVIILDQHVCLFLNTLFHFLVFSPKNTNGKGQSQRLPIKEEDGRQNNGEPDVHHKRTQRSPGDLTRGQQDLGKASERQQRGNASEKVRPDTQRTQK